MTRIDQRFDAVDARFDRMEHRLDRIEQRLDRVIHQQVMFGWGLAAAFMAQFVAFVLTSH